MNPIQNNFNNNQNTDINKISDGNKHPSNNVTLLKIMITLFSKLMLAVAITLFIHIKNDRKYFILF